MTLRSIDVLLFVALPYAAMVLFVAGLIWRFRTGSTVSSRSSQILEDRALLWGTIPFHLGIAVLLTGHLLPLLAPGAWQSLVSNPRMLVAIEATGLAAAVVCIAGLTVLFLRRALSRHVRPGSNLADLLVLSLLLAQAILGVIVASGARWGALWSVATTTPYLWSLVTLRPDPTYVSGLPAVMALHLSGAWILLALLPFTRLVHMLLLPLGYLFRRPQKVIFVRA